VADVVISNWSHGGLWVCPYAADFGRNELKCLQNRANEQARKLLTRYVLH
jgi:hypothetical protein